MQDELALVREDLRTLRQQRRGEAAKPQQNDRLFKTLDEDIHHLGRQGKAAHGDACQVARGTPSR